MHIHVGTALYEPYIVHTFYSNNFVIFQFQELSTSSPLALTLQFEDEQSEDKCAWVLLFQTTDSLNTLLASIRTYWEALFGVDLTIQHKSS